MADPIAKELTWHDFVPLVRSMLIEVGLKDYADTGAVPVLAEYLLELRQQPLAEMQERLLKLHDRAGERIEHLGNHQVSSLTEQELQEYADLRQERSAFARAVLAVIAVATKKPPTKVGEE